MLRKMDIRLSQALDAMIVQKIRKTPALLYGDKLAIGESWVGVICNLASEFESLADPDALNAIPILASVCDILYEISTKRKQLGIDARLRELNRGRVSSDSADVW